MKILVVSWYFPPVNTIGAVRVGKFVRFLIEQGHDVGVVAGAEWGHPETLPLGVPLDRVAYVRSRDVNALPNAIIRPVKKLLRRGGAAGGAPSSSSTDSAPTGSSGASRLRRLSDLYVNLTNLPDSHIGWFAGALKGGRSLCRSWHPDLIFASGPPFTALLVAQRLSARLRVPWVAELRDRWADDPYDEIVPWRARLNQWLERRVLRSAVALVTVTEPWAEFYRAKYQKPLATIYNGYDPLDFPDATATETPFANPNLVIGYTGGIYPGRRDPTPLFDALHLLGSRAHRIRVVFCGTDPAHVLPLAERAGVRSLVEVRPSVPYKESLEFQRNADVLLLMQWNDPREQGNCPGKFFEYMASLRPVLVLGLEDGVPATIVRQRSAGFCSNDPQRIAEQLTVWLRDKEKFGHTPMLPASTRAGLSRTIQYERLEKFLGDLVKRP